MTRSLWTHVLYFSKIYIRTDTFNHHHLRSFFVMKEKTHNLTNPKYIFMTVLLLTFRTKWNDVALKSFLKYMHLYICRFEGFIIETCKNICRGIMLQMFVRYALFIVFYKIMAAPNEIYIEKHIIQKNWYQMYVYKGCISPYQLLKPKSHLGYK